MRNLFEDFLLLCVSEVRADLFQIRRFLAAFRAIQPHDGFDFELFMLLCFATKFIEYSCS